MRWRRICRSGASRTDRREQASLAPWLRFKSAVDGAVALEFAIVAPAFFLLLLFPISLGYTMVLKQGLDYATSQVAEKIATGQVQAAQLNQANFISTIVCPKLPSIFTCANVIVNVQNVPTTDASFPSEYYAFVNASPYTALIPPPTTNAQASYCIGNAQNYVYLQILYPIPSLFALLPGSPGMTSVNGQMVYMVTSTATFLNEPFVAPPVAC